MSNREEYQTEDALFDALNAEFKFTFDAACTSASRRCPRGACYDMGVDSLQLDWLKESKKGWVWLNPPYSSGKIGPFLFKTANEAKRGTRVVALLRCDPSTRWFQVHVWPWASELRLLPKRVRFHGVLIDDEPVKGGYDFPSCVAVFDKRQRNGDDNLAIRFYDWQR